MLLAQKSPEIFPKHNDAFFQSLLLWTDIFLYHQQRKPVLFYLEKFNEYWASNVISSTPCIGAK